MYPEKDTALDKNTVFHRALVKCRILLSFNCSKSFFGPSDLSRLSHVYWGETKFVSVLKQINL